MPLGDVPPLSPLSLGGLTGGFDRRYGVTRAGGEVIPDPSFHASIPAPLQPFNLFQNAGVVPGVYTLTAVWNLRPQIKALVAPVFSLFDIDTGQPLLRPDGTPMTEDEVPAGVQTTSLNQLSTDLANDPEAQEALGSYYVMESVTKLVGEVFSNEDLKLDNDASTDDQPTSLDDGITAVRNSVVDALWDDTQDNEETEIDESLPRQRVMDELEGSIIDADEASGTNLLNTEIENLTLSYQDGTTAPSILTGGLAGSTFAELFEIARDPSADPEDQQDALAVVILALSNLPGVSAASISSFTDDISEISVNGDSGTVSGIRNQTGSGEIQTSDVPNILRAAFGLNPAPSNTPLSPDLHQTNLNLLIDAASDGSDSAASELFGFGGPGDARPDGSNSFNGLSLDLLRNMQDAGIDLQALASNTAVNSDGETLIELYAKMVEAMIDGELVELKFPEGTIADEEVTIEARDPLDFMAKMHRRRIDIANARVQVTQYAESQTRINSGESSVDLESQIPDPPPSSSSTTSQSFDVDQITQELDARENVLEAFAAPAMTLHGVRDSVITGTTTNISTTGATATNPFAANLASSLNQRVENIADSASGVTSLIQDRVANHPAIGYITDLYLNMSLMGTTFEAQNSYEYLLFLVRFEELLFGELSAGLGLASLRGFDVTSVGVDGEDGSTISSLPGALPTSGTNTGIQLAVSFIQNAVGTAREDLFGPVRTSLDTARQNFQDGQNERVENATVTFGEA